MEKTYNILLRGTKVGIVNVSREGLYYRFRCRCRLEDGKLHKLIVICGDRKADLGVCVPIGNEYGLNASVAVKHIGEGEFRFQLVAKYEDSKEHFIPLREEKPFLHIDKLQKAHLRTQNGQIGIVLSDG